ncbi:hypothetical protein H5410_063093 [Solanum commersonii]|uniref:Uncharacterized protein n=1 Tax=Solanum commersonii TaxID=4109 RepID=A0A9J5WDD4_SOLCO|nr:hypothetical protein H5410_063093 [Solanum commersonii]
MLAKRVPMNVGTSANGSITNKPTAELKTQKELSIKAAAKTAATADPATATLFKEAELGDSVGEPPGAAAMDGGEAAPEGDDDGVSAAGGAGGDANGESDGEDAVVGGFAGATIGGVDVVGGGVTTGGDATGAGELFGEAAGDAPGACAKADPATNANIRAIITFEYAILALRRKESGRSTKRLRGRNGNMSCDYF